MRTPRHLVACAVLLSLACASPAAAAPSTGPKLTVPRAKLAAAFHCPASVRNAKKTPIMLVTGTGATGEQAWGIGKDAINTYGHPGATSTFPTPPPRTSRSPSSTWSGGCGGRPRWPGRKVAVFGISQGGLLPRMRPDVLAGPAEEGVGRALGRGHPARHRDRSRVARRVLGGEPVHPAAWQQKRGSKLLKALNSYPDETPGNVSYTTVRSLTDETVQPQGGRHPTSALAGASTS